MDTVLNKNVKLTAFYKVVVKFNNEVFILDLPKGQSARIGLAQNAEGQTLDDVMKKLKEDLPDTKHRLYFIDENGSELDENFETEKDMVINSQVTIKVLINDTETEVKEGTLVKDVQILSDLASKGNFAYFVDENGNQYTLESVLDDNVSLTAVYNTQVVEHKVTINFDGEDFILELKEGESLQIGQAQNIKGQTLEEVMINLRKNLPITKNSVYFVDSFGNKVYYTTVTDKDMIVSSKYTVRVEVSGKVITVDENTLVKDVSVLNDLASKENFVYFEDEKGNRYTLDSIINENVKLVAYSKLIIPNYTDNNSSEDSNTDINNNSLVNNNPQTLDNITYYISIAIISIFAILAELLIAKKQKIFNK